jgi:heat shock protein HslJ/uncharacterized membrane protein
VKAAVHAGRGIDVAVMGLQIAASAAVALALLPAAPAAAQSQTYRAHGTEPFWSLTIANRRIVYERAGERPISVPAAPALVRGAQRSYRSGRLRVEIVRAEPCSNGMSDRLYADHVRVFVGREIVGGCGGEVLPPATLAGTSWRIVDIAGADVSRADGYRIDFEAERLNGRAGCNSLSGPYRVGRDGFQAGPLTMTRMACPAPRMAHEQTAARILRERVRLFYPDGETLLMRSAAGTMRLRRVN